MKKLIKVLFVITALSLASNVSAEELSKLEKCTMYSNLAESVMSARQKNIDMVKVYKIAESDQGSEKLMKLIINAAYKLPAYRTETYQQKAVANFKNKIFLECVTK